jgi:hypothetical protein
MACGRKLTDISANVPSLFVRTDSATIRRLGEQSSGRLTFNIQASNATPAGAVTAAGGSGADFAALPYAGRSGVTAGRDRPILRMVRRGMGTREPRGALSPATSPLRLRAVEAGVVLGMPSINGSQCWRSRMNRPPSNSFNSVQRVAPELIAGGWDAGSVDQGHWRSPLGQRQIPASLGLRCMKAHRAGDTTPATCPVASLPREGPNDAVTRPCPTHSPVGRPFAVGDEWNGDTTINRDPPGHLHRLGNLLAPLRASAGGAVTALSHPGVIHDEEVAAEGGGMKADRAVPARVPLLSHSWGSRRGLPSLPVRPAASGECRLLAVHNYYSRAD